jgi:hypothetical protein
MADRAAQPPSQLLGFAKPAVKVTLIKKRRGQ